MAKVPLLEGVDAIIHYGGAYAVYFARTTAGELLAVKGGNRGSRSGRLARRESELLQYVRATSKNSHVIPVVDEWRSEKEYYFATPLRPLEPGLNCPLPVVADIVRQQCEAVAGLHKAGVVHRDLGDSQWVYSVTGGSPLVELIDLGEAGVYRALPLRTSHRRSSASAIRSDVRMLCDSILSWVPGYMYHFQTPLRKTFPQLYELRILLNDCTSLSALQDITHRVQEEVGSIDAAGPPLVPRYTKELERLAQVEKGAQ
jgi:serine/threonine protein kinase